LGVDLAGRVQVNVPRIGVGLESLFVAEGEPAPVKTGTAAVSLVGPAKKMVSITSFTNELAALSAQSAEAVIRTAMIEAAAHSRKTLNRRSGTPLLHRALSKGG
jgi:hypothetical protein